MLTIAGREQTKVVFRGFVVGQTLSRHRGYERHKNIFLTFIWLGQSRRC